MMSSENSPGVLISALLTVFIIGALSLRSLAQPYDLLIKNAKVLDGTGNPWFRADIAIQDDRIADMGSLGNAQAIQTLDASEYFVVPGFIDVHTHAASGLEEESLSGAEPLVRQGITSVIVNPDGGGYTNLEKQREQLLEYGIGVNVAQLVPHGSVRREVMGMENRKASPEELEEMGEFVRKGMIAGAFGMSSGPFYAPGSYASTEELISLANIVAEYGGVYTSHIRDESNYTIGLEAAVQEVITVAESAELPGIVTHIKALGPPVWGLSETIVQNIEEARGRGVQIYADQYPYMASATSLIAALIPRWAEEGGHEALVKRLEDPELFSEIRSAMEENLSRRGGAARIQFRYYEADAGIEGKSLEEVAGRNNVDPITQAIELIKRGRPGIVSFNMNEEDVHRFMKQSWTMTGSDGGLGKMGEGVPHPRSYAAFTEKISRFVVQDSVIDLSQAIRSMTSLPARVFGINDRGMLRTGMKADLLIFKPEDLRSEATYQDPHHLAEGMEYVIINGDYAIRAGDFLDTRNGQILRNSTDR